MEIYPLSVKIKITCTIFLSGVTSVGLILTVGGVVNMFGEAPPGIPPDPGIPELGATPGEFKIFVTGMGTDDNGD